MTQNADPRVAALEAALIAADIDRLILAEGLTKHARLLREALKGVATVKDFAGEQLVRYRDGEVSVSGEEYVARLKAENPNINSSPAASAERKPLPPSTQGVRNPFRSRTFNLTEQFALARTNPALAAALQEEADNE